MKTGLVFTLGCIITLFFAVGASGEDKPTRPDTTSVQSSKTIDVTDADAMVGKKVESRDGKDLGQVKKIIRNTTNGQPEYAIVASANKLYPVPLSAFTTQASKETLALNIDKKKFSTAPSYPEDKMPDMSSPAINLLVNKFYSSSPS